MAVVAAYKNVERQMSFVIWGVRAAPRRWCVGACRRESHASNRCRLTNIRQSQEVRGIPGLL